METNNGEANNTLANTVVLNAARPQQAGGGFDLSKSLKWVGLGLLGVTGFLIWREVSLDAVVLMLGASGVTTGAALMLERKKREVVGPMLALLAVIAASGWYAMTRNPVVIGSLALGVATFGALSWIHRKRGTSTHRTISLQGLAWSALSLSLATDFHLFHASEIGNENFLARRVILTVAWLVPGLAMLVFGGKREDRAVQAAGMVMTVAALGKLLVYDTVSLEGVLRIASYGVAGALTLLAGQLLTRKAPVLAAQGQEAV